MRALAGFAALTLALGCELAPDVGPPLVDRCVSEDSNPGTDVDFESQIHQGIIVVHCLPCHDPAGLNNTGFQVSGLDLTSVASLRKGGSNGGADIVRPGDPCQSVIVNKLSSGPPFGNRMPFDGPPFLSASQRQLVHDWIAEGANP